MLVSFVKTQLEELRKDESLDLVSNQLNTTSDSIKNILNNIDSYYEKYFGTGKTFFILVLLMIVAFLFYEESRFFSNVLFIQLG
jgi:hypothetical protein